MQNFTNKEILSNFDLSKETSGNYFKSSFARSMAFGNSTQSKSLDFVFNDNCEIKEECENNVKCFTNNNITESKELSSSKQKCVSLTLDEDCGNKCLKFCDLKNNVLSQESIRKVFSEPWDLKEVVHKESSSTECREKENPIAITGEEQDDEILGLRKGCQNSVDKNCIQEEISTNSHLQLQVDTLQWQLKQTEASRQMYQAVLEQVSKFLERIYRDLQPMQNKTLQQVPKKSVPRSRSVHTVPSRPPSPSPTVISQNHFVQRANSITHMQGSTAPRDLSWRVPRLEFTAEVSPDVLSQEAFRLLRTIHSLLGTREPDLANRLTPISDPCSDYYVGGDSRKNSWLNESCRSFLQSSYIEKRKSLESCSSQVPLLYPREEDAPRSETVNSSTPQLSVSSNEDESGFSSLSSFQEVGLPEIHSLSDVGLPIIHSGEKRWSSVPTQQNLSLCAPQDSSIRVLWV